VTNVDAPRAADEVDPLLGAVLLDRVRIVRVLARGGMGTVYYGEQTRLNRPCAVKVLDPRLVAGDDAGEVVGRFLLEASVAAKLTHPNVVTVFDYGETPQGSCFIAMEYLEGRSLAEELKATGRLSPERTMHIAEQVGRALREAHELGHVHRDVKPGNVFLIDRDDDEDFVKVLDFGLVKETHSAGGPEPAQSAQIMGSPRYMAPEQVQGKGVDARTDVYALGATMYTMLTGHAPFDRVTELATMMAQVSDPPPPMAAAASDLVLPPGLEAVVMKCLSKDPDDRYRSMEDFVVALRGPRVALDSPPLAPAQLIAPVISRRTFAVRSKPGRGGVALGKVALIGGLVVGAGGAGALVSRRFPAERAAVAVSPAAPQAGAPAATSATPVAALTATLHVETAPAGAKVKEEGDTLCEATPCDIAYGGEGASSTFEHLLVFMKADYKVESKLVTVAASPVRVKLTKAR
jgi:predicted Ser/Thr protein kinase